jgi:hypothetical protein
MGMPGMQGEDGESGLDSLIPGPQGPQGELQFQDFNQDLGNSYRSGTFDLTGLVDLNPGSNVLVVQTEQDIPSKGSCNDEPEMDLIKLTGYVLNPTTIRVQWDAPTVVTGTYTFAYCVSKAGPGVIGTAWTDVAYDAADFTGDGTIVWTVEAADLENFAYKWLNSSTVALALRINFSSVSGTGISLNVELPAEIAPLKDMALTVLLIDNGTINAGGFMSASAGLPFLSFFRSDFANFAASANATGVFINVVYEV